MRPQLNDVPRWVSVCHACGLDPTVEILTADETSVSITVEHDEVVGEDTYAFSGTFEVERCP